MSKKVDEVYLQDAMTLGSFMSNRKARVSQDPSLRRNTFLLFLNDEELNTLVGKSSDEEINLEVQREIEIRKSESGQ